MGQASHAHNLSHLVARNVPSHGWKIHGRMIANSCAVTNRLRGPNTGQTDSNHRRIATTVDVGLNVVATSSRVIVIIVTIVINRRDDSWHDTPVLIAWQQGRICQKLCSAASH
jgi:hypothetical protein